MLYGQLQRKRRFRLNEASKATPGPQSKAIGINANTKDTQDDVNNSRL